MTMFAAYCIVDELNEANELKRCEIDIQRQRLELEQRLSEYATQCERSSVG